jgi:hypothetical protein
MGWTNLGEKPLVETPWFQLKLAEVELPGGRQLDHYLLRLPPLVLTAVLDGDDRVLPSSTAATRPPPSTPAACWLCHLG